MSFLDHFKRKKKDQKPANTGGNDLSRVPTSVVSLPKKEQRIVKNKMKKINKELPIMRLLKPKPLALSYLADHLEEAANNHDGAVRLIKDDQGYEAFTAIAITEDMFASMGFSPTKKQNPDGYRDLGAVAAQISRNEIFSATTIIDYSEHRMVLVPTHHTLESLKEYSEFSDKKNQFHWAAIPKDYLTNNDVHHAAAIICANMVNLAELVNIDVNDLELALDDDKQVVVVDNQEQQNDTSADNADNETDEDDSNEDDVVGDEGFDPTTQLNNDVSDQSETPVVQSQGETDDFTNTTDAMLNNSNIGDSVSTDSGAISSDAMSDLMSHAGVNNVDDLTNTSTDDDLDLNQIPDDNGQVNNQGANVDEIPQAQTQEEFTANTAEAVAANDNYKQTIDKDLHLTVDFAVFNEMSKYHKPIQFSISSVSENDKLGQMANSYREGYNSQLRAMSQQQENTLRGIFESRASQAAAYISQKVNALNDEGTKQAKRRKAIEDSHRTDLDALETNWPSIVKQKRQNYKERREAVGNSAKEKAMSDFDANHRAQFEQSLANDKNQRIDQINTRYFAQLAEEKQKRVSLAQNAYAVTLSRIMNDINQQRDEFYEKNKQQFMEFEDSLHKTLNDNYKSEQERQIAASQVLAHDHKVEQANQRADQAEKEYQAKLKQAQADFDARLSKVQTLSEDNVRQARESYQARLDTLQSQYEQSQKNAVSNLDQYRKDIAAAKQDAQEQLERLADEHTRNDKAKEQQNKQTVRNAFIISILLAILGLFIGLTIGMMIKGHNTLSSSSQQPAKTEQTANTNSKQPTIIEKQINYHGKENKDDNSGATKSSASTSESASQTTQTTKSSNASSSVQH